MFMIPDDMALIRGDGVAQTPAAVAARARYSVLSTREFRDPVVREFARKLLDGHTASAPVAPMTGPTRHLSLQISLRAGKREWRPVRT
jgi:hypothetical protein